MGKFTKNDSYLGKELKELEYVLANGLEHVGALAFSSTDDEVPMQLTRDGWKYFESLGLCREVS